MRRTPLVLVALAVAALSLIAAACQPSTNGIATDAVSRATVTEVVDVPASVTAKAVATLTAPADGTLATLAVTPGSPVAKGDVVAVIDSASARKRLADAKAALTAANSVGAGIGYVDLAGLQKGLDDSAADAFGAARSAAAEVTDEKVRAALLAHVDAAQKNYDATAKASKRVLRQVQQGIAGIGQAVSALGAAQKAQAKAAYDVANATVEALTLRAPIAGVVQFARPSAGTSSDPLAGLLGAVSGTSSAASTAGQNVAEQNVAGVDDVLSVGDQVSAGSAIVTIVDVSEIGLVGEVDETDVLLVAPGVSADVDLDAAPGLPFEATVGTVDLLPTPSARGGVAYRIRLSFQPVKPGDSGQPRPTPRPGMSAVAHLRVRSAVDAVAVPAAAVFSSDNGETVWVVRDGQAVRQPVRVGVQGADLVQILSGLEPGQRVVTSGTDKVTAGQAVS
jgi:multidrug efflux pump subunit AcrA (membrane-fusion protein)